MKECKILVSINLCLLLMFNCMCPVALAFQESETTETVFEEVQLVETSEPEEEIPEENFAAEDAMGANSAEESTVEQKSVEQEATAPFAETVAEEDPDVVASGLCGAGVTWSLSTEGVLTIAGSGTMENYETAASAPWYDYESSIKSLVVEDEVLSVGERAFYCYERLSGIALADSITEIGDWAFYGCKSLQNVVLPDELTVLGNYTFEYCTGLTGIEWPEKLTVIGLRAFRDCTGLQSVVLPNSLTRIEGYAFSGCTNLQIVELPESLVNIEYWAFGDCSKLQHIEFPDSLTSLGYSAFNGCAGLQSISFGTGLTTLQSDVFRNCNALVTVDIPDGVTEIRDGTFYGCDNLSEVTIGSGISRIGYHAFSDCASLAKVTIDQYEMLVTTNESFSPTAVVTYKEVDPEMPIQMWNVGVENESDVIASLYHDGRLVIEGTGSFKSIRWPAMVTSVEIGTGITNIPYRAFYDYDGLQSIKLPDSLTSIGEYAFYDCDGLQSIELPDSLTSIGNYAFYDCEALTEVAIGSGIRSIGNSAFSGCTSLAQVTIDQYEILVDFDGVFPETVTVTYKTPDVSAPIQVWDVGDEDETDATAVLYGDGKLVIDGTGGFKYLGWPDAVTEVVIGDGITSMPSNAFSSCTNLRSVKIGGGIQTISSRAFSYCTNLTDIVFEGDIKTINNQAFSSCVSLACIDLGESIRSIGYSAFYNTGLTEIVIPDSVKSIGDSAFAGCSSLKSIYIGTGLYSLGYSAFSDCTGLKQITWNAADFNKEQLGSGTMVFYAAGKNTSGVTLTIGADVTYIPDYLFYVSSNSTDGAVNLVSVENLSEQLTEVGNFAFYNCKALKEVELGDAITGIGDSAFNSCTSLDLLTLPRTLESIGRKAFFRTGLESVILGRNVSAIGEDAFSQCSDSFVMSGYKNSYAQSYAEERGIPFEVIETILVTLHGNRGVMPSLQIDLDLGEALSLAEYSETLQEEMNDYIPDTPLTRWDTMQDGSGDSYDLDALLLLTSDTELYAQWAVPFVEVDGTRFCVDQNVLSLEWGTYYWDRQEKIGRLHLDNYQGGSISSPADLCINVTGNCSINEELGVAIKARDLVIQLKEGSALTIATGGTDAAVNCTNMNIRGSGDISVLSECSVGVYASNQVIYQASGWAEFIASQVAVSASDLRLGSQLDVYLSADTYEKSEEYDGGAYLRLEPKSWSLSLNANGGIWDDEAGTIKTVKTDIYEEVDLTPFSEQVSNDGYVLVGWCDQEDGTEYDIDGLVASSDDLVLYAIWTECTLVVDGKSYDPSRAQTGDGWRYIPAGNNDWPYLYLTDYCGGGIYSTSDIRIVSSGVTNVTGMVGEPAIEILGALNLVVSDGTATILGGSGEHAVYVADTATIENQASLSVQGGAGGAAIHGEKDVFICNDGEFSAVGGTISHAVFAEGETVVEGQGKDIFVSGALGCPAVSGGNLILNDVLKLYGGDNASKAERRVAYPRIPYSYVRVQPKTIIVTLNMNGGVAPENVQLVEEYAQTADNSICLNVVSDPTRFGYAFSGWNSKVDGTGDTYVSGDNYIFEETADAVELFAQWEELEYDVAFGESVTVRLREDLPENTTALLTVYTPKGQMDRIVSGECGKDGVWIFQDTVILPNEQFKVFFLDEHDRPARGMIFYET